MDTKTLLPVIAGHSSRPSMNTEHTGKTDAHPR
jgi:hypothetical protein